MLDLQSVRLFVLAAELGNFSRAAEAAGTVQPVVSQRVRALESALGRRLLERTPRYVRTTADGAAFLAHARALLAAHDAAVCFRDGTPTRFALAASDHAIGASLEAVIKALRATLGPGALLELRLGLSQQMRGLYDAGEVDAVVLRRESGGAEGEVLGHDPLGWRGRAEDGIAAGETLPLVTLGAPCGVRAAAVRELERSGRPWRETFTGGGCAALVAAVQAGLGIAPMGEAASGQLPDVGKRLGLPALPPSEIVLIGRAATPQAAEAIRSVARCLRAALRA